MWSLRAVPLYDFSCSENEKGAAVLEAPEKKPKWRAQGKSEKSKLPHTWKGSGVRFGAAREVGLHGSADQKKSGQQCSPVRLLLARWQPPSGGEPEEETEKQLFQFYVQVKMVKVVALLDPLSADFR
nr:hypothetical protein Q903MT_gene3653 [Picea sitchensis]